MTNEIEDLHKPFMNYLEKLKLKYRRISAKNHYRDSSDGVPDFEVFLKDGRPVFIEFKTEEKYKLKDHNLRPKQKEWIDFLYKNCYNILVTCSLQDAINFIEEWK